MQSTHPAGGGSTYFAAPATEDVAGKILQKVSAYDESSLYADTIRARLATAYRYYYGFDAEGNHVTSSIHRDGEQGELAKYRVNHARRHVNTLLNLVISQRVVWQPKATNIDYDSVRQCEIASAVLEYYWHERQVEKYVARAVEEAIAFTEGFVMGEWDEFAGEDVAPNPDALPAAAPPAQPDTSYGPNGPEDTAAPVEAAEAAPEDEAPPEGAPAEAAPTGPAFIKSGDLHFENVSSWNVIRDPNKASWEALDWVIVRTWRNKFDLAARFPSVAKHVLDCPAQFRSDASSITPAPLASDDIEVFYFFHKRTPAVPNGREIVVLPNKTVLRDDELSYDEIPVYRVSPTDIIGTPYGYSPFLEVLGIQELIDSLQSGIATNQTTFTVQNIVAEHGTEVDADQIDGGMRLILIPPGGKEPKALQLCATPPETFKHLDELKKDEEKLFGLNAAVSGQLETDRLSGAAMALLDANAKQQSSGLHGAARRLVQNLGNFVIRTLARRCWAPRKIALVGNDFASLLTEEAYDRNSFGLIHRVQVDAGNPLAQTAAGRIEMAQQLLQMQLIQTPEQYYQVLTTGRLEPVTRGLMNELALIRSENEDVSRGELPVALMHDNHLLHGKEHRIPVSSPQARKNPAVLQAHMEHMHQHYELYFGNPVDQPAIDPMTGQPAVDPMTGEPLMQRDPLYRERMMILCGLQPPAPPMPPAGVPGEGPPPAAPPGAEPGKAEQAALPDFPKQPKTGREWDPQTAGGAVDA